MTLPTITAQPVPPTSADPVTFDPRADAFVASFATLRTEINAFGSAVPGEVTSLATSTATGVATTVAGAAALTGGMFAANQSDGPRLYNLHWSDLHDAAAGMTGSGPFLMANIASGTFGAITALAAHPGVVSISSSATTNSGGYIKLGGANSGNILLSGGEVFECLFRTPPSHIAAPLRAGFFDTITSAAPADGVYFDLTGNVLTAVTFANSVGSSTVMSNLSASTWYQLVLKVNAAATAVDYSVYLDNGTQVGSTVQLTTNIPASTGRELDVGLVATSTTASSLICWLDYLAYYRNTALQRGTVIGSAGAVPSITSALRTVAVPNATVPAHALLATGAETSIDLVLSPKNAGSLLANTPDNATTGGNKRNAFAVDLQLARTAAASVASGGWSVISGGDNNAAAGNYAAVPGGQSNSAATDYSMAIGRFAVARASGALAHGTAASVVAGHRQVEQLVLTRTSSNTIPQVLSTDGNPASAVNQLTLPNNSAIHAQITVVARNPSAVQEAKSWTGSVLIRRGVTAAATVLVGAPAMTSDFGDAAMAACAVALTADTTNGALAITVTGLAATTITWVARVDAAEVVASV